MVDLRSYIPLRDWFLSNAQDDYNQNSEPPEPVEMVLWFLALLVGVLLFLVFVKWLLRLIEAVINIISYGMYITTIVAVFCTGLYIVLYCHSNSSECLALMGIVFAKTRPYFDYLTSLSRNVIDAVAAQFY